jgi:hypothetical protein
MILFDLVFYLNAHISILFWFIKTKKYSQLMIYLDKNMMYLNSLLIKTLINDFIWSNIGKIKWGVCFKI